MEPVNIASLIDGLIPFFGGIFLVVMSLIPERFIKDETTLEKFKKRKVMFIILGALCAAYGVARILMKL